MDKNFPKFICLKNAKDSKSNRNALILLSSKDNKARYWRHAGVYDAKAQYIDGKLMVCIEHCEPYEYEECTEAEWKESNGEYASEKYGYKGWLLC